MPQKIALDKRQLCWWSSWLDIRGLVLRIKEMNDKNVSIILIHSATIKIDVEEQNNAIYIIQGVR